MFMPDLQWSGVRRDHLILLNSIFAFVWGHYITHNITQKVTHAQKYFLLQEIHLSRFNCLTTILVKVSRIADEIVVGYTLIFQQISSASGWRYLDLARQLWFQR